MAYGYNGSILRVDLSQGKVSVEHPEDNFYRKYFGGKGFIAYYLLKELKPKVDPLSSENILVFAAGPLTGAPIPGPARIAVGAKSPLSNTLGHSEFGGYFGSELKQAGYDAIIIEGKAEIPVYLWIKDGEVEIREATHLWGKFTSESMRIIREELGDKRIRTAMIGPAGEKSVRYACIVHDLRHFAGRWGMGAVMGSKNLKAIAVRGHKRLPIADREAVNALAKWVRDNLPITLMDMDLDLKGWLDNINSSCCPTCNFREGPLDVEEKWTEEVRRGIIARGKEGCYACPIRCRPYITQPLKEPYVVDPMYGGPDYEAVGSLGTCCGVSDLRATIKANELCNAYGLDVISAGVTISFAMECFERGILTKEDTDGIELCFGNAEAMVQVVGMIGKREGIGNLLAEGSFRAAQRIGKGTMEYAMQSKGMEIPMHEPRLKPGMGLSYMTMGADHVQGYHDTWFDPERGHPWRIEDVKAMGVLESPAWSEISPAKARVVVYQNFYRNLFDCLLICVYVPYRRVQIVDLVRAVTGWNTTFFELIKVGERCINMMRAFNIREGFTKEDDALPNRFFTPFTSGPLKGVSIDKEKLTQALDTYYSMMGWEPTKGVPTLAKLQELGIEWIAKGM